MYTESGAGGGGAIDWHKNSIHKVTWPVAPSSEELSERASQEDQNGANFSFIAPSSEE